MYSYSILLLEMFTEKRPTYDMLHESSKLDNFVKVALSEQVVEIAEPVIIQEILEGEMSTIFLMRIA